MQADAPNGVRSSELVRCKCGNNTFEKRKRITGVWVSSIILTAAGVVETDGTTDRLQARAEPKYLRCELCGEKQINPASNTQ